MESCATPAQPSAAGWAAATNGLETRDVHKTSLVYVKLPPAVVTNGLQVCGVATDALETGSPEQGFPARAEPSQNG